MQIGEIVTVRAYKADATCYRRWQATVEAATLDHVALVTPPGHWVDDVGGGWVSQYAIRAHYWPGRRYSLLEVYTPGGRLEEVYVNINSPVEIEDAEIRFTDYELDVSRRPPGEARIVDQDEFRAAAAKYGYSDEFQRSCYQVAEEAVELANQWIAAEMPTIETTEAAGEQL